MSWCSLHGRNDSCDKEPSLERELSLLRASLADEKQKVANLEEYMQKGVAFRDELQASLAEKEGQLCATRKMLDRYAAWAIQNAPNDLAMSNIMDEVNALSSPTPCPHEARVKEMGQRIDTVHAVSENNRKMFEDAHNECIRLMEEVMLYRREAPPNVHFTVQEELRRRAAAAQGVTMDIDTMEAGREMDALVAEKVMGWKCSCGKTFTLNPHGLKEFCGVHGNAPSVPEFSSSVAAAWEVVEKMLKHSDQVTYLRFQNDVAINGWCAPQHTICLRICRAALKALQEEIMLREYIITAPRSKGKL